ncbi:hypothetical protein PCE1_004860 [Barthelona sp. PCE]
MSQPQNIEKDSSEEGQSVSTQLDPQNTSESNEIRISDHVSKTSILLVTCTAASFMFEYHIASIVIVYFLAFLFVAFFCSMTTIEHNDAFLLVFSVCTAPHIMHSSGAGLPSMVLLLASYIYSIKPLRFISIFILSGFCLIKKHFFVRIALAFLPVVVQQRAKSYSKLIVPREFWLFSQFLIFMNNSLTGFLFSVALLAFCFGISGYGLSLAGRMLRVILITLVCFIAQPPLRFVFTTQHIDYILTIVIKCLPISLISIGTAFVFVHLKIHVIYIRKVFHFTIFVLFLVCRDLPFFYETCGFVLYCFVVIEIIRFDKKNLSSEPKGIAKLFSFMSKFVDDREKGNLFVSHIFLLLGSSLNHVLNHPVHFDMVCVIVLGIGDSLAVLIGKSVKSKIIHNSKTLAGSIALFVTTIVLLFKYAHHPMLNPAGTIFACAVAVLCELFIDGFDNLIVPLILSVTMVNTHHRTLIINRL